jgi:hypothetical protein
MKRINLSKAVFGADDKGLTIDLRPCGLDTSDHGVVLDDGRQFIPVNSDWDFLFAYARGMVVRVHCERVQVSGLRAVRRAHWVAFSARYVD